MSLQSPPAATAVADLPPDPGAELPPGAELNQGSEEPPSAEEGGGDAEEQEEEGEKEKEREKLLPIPSASSAAAGVGLRPPAGPGDPSAPGVAPGLAPVSETGFAVPAGICCVCRFIRGGGRSSCSFSCSFLSRASHSSFLKITSASVTSDIMKL